MNLFNKVLIKEYPDPLMREDRINLIARCFSQVTDEMYDEWKNTIAKEIQKLGAPPLSTTELEEMFQKVQKYDPFFIPERKKRKFQEQLQKHQEYLDKKGRLERSADKDKREFLRDSVSGVRSIFQRVYEKFDQSSLELSSKITCPLPRLKLEYKKIQDCFWDLAEAAASVIRMQEGISICTSREDKIKWLNDYTLDDTNYEYNDSLELNILNPVRKKVRKFDYTDNCLTQLSVISDKGVVEKDDLGFPRICNSVNKLYAKVLLNYGIYRFNLRTARPLPSMTGRRTKEAQEIECPSSYKTMLTWLGNQFPIIKKLYSNEIDRWCGLLDNDDKIISFFKGYRYSKPDYYNDELLYLLRDCPTSLLLWRWFFNIKETTPRITVQTIYTEVGAVDLSFAKNTILPTVDNLIHELNSLQLSENDYGKELINYLDNTTSLGTTSWESLVSILRSLGIGEDAEYLWCCLISSSIHKHKTQSKIIDVLSLVKCIISNMLNHHPNYEGTSAKYDLFEDNFYSYLCLTEYLHPVFDKGLSPHLPGREYLERNFATKLTYHNISSKASDPYFELDNHEITRGIIDSKLWDDIKSGVSVFIKEVSIISEEGRIPRLLYNYDLPDEKHYLFFDTETVGLPVNPSAPSSMVSNWPRLIQISWILTNSKGVHYREKSFIIKPSGFVITQEATYINGISMERAISEGADLDFVLKEFVRDCKRANYLVGHNVLFDKRVVGAEMLRLGMKDTISAKSSFCTMTESVLYCDILGRNNKHKYPTLMELYIKLFGVGFKNAHDSSADVAATEKCFWELNRLGIIDINNPLPIITNDPSRPKSSSFDPYLPF